MYEKMEQHRIDSRSIEQWQKEHERNFDRPSANFGFEKTEQKPKRANYDIIRGTRMEKDNGAKGRKGAGGGEGEERRVKECSPICTRLPKNLPANSWSPNCHFTRGLLSWKPRPRKPPLVATTPPLKGVAKALCIPQRAPRRGTRVV